MFGLHVLTEGLTCMACALWFGRLEQPDSDEVFADNFKDREDFSLIIRGWMFHASSFLTPAAS